MAEKFGITGVRFRYSAALGIAALFCVLFVFVSDISNRQFKVASHVATLIANFDVTISESYQLIGIIAGEAHGTSVAESHQSSLDDKITEAGTALKNMRASWESLPERLRNELDLSGFSADQQMGNLERIIDFVDQGKWDAADAAKLKDGYSFLDRKSVV